MYNQAAPGYRTAPIPRRRIKSPAIEVLDGLYRSSGLRLHGRFMGYIVWQNEPLELEIRILISAGHFIILLITVVLLNMQINGLAACEEKLKNAASATYNAYNRRLKSSVARAAAREFLTHHSPPSATATDTGIRVSR